MFQCYAIMSGCNIVVDSDMRPYFAPVDKESLDALEQIVQEMRLEDPKAEFRLVILQEQTQ